MQLTMAYSNELSMGMPPYVKGTVGGGASRFDITKQPLKRPQRLQSKSQPFDPEDLRRRLYVVIAEREAQNEKRQRQRVDALPAKWAQVEKDRDTQVYIERLPGASTTWAAPDTTAPVVDPISAPISKPPSRQDRARRRRSMITSSERADTTTAAAAETNTTGTGYRHIPEVAAAQFSRTTTSTGMQGDKSLVHSLSKAAVRFYAEGASAADRQAIDSSITPGRQRSLLQRTRSQKEQQHGRNQFQAPRLASGDDAPSSAAAAAAAPSRRRGSKSNPGGDATIVEESALADLHLHAFPSQGSDRGVGGGGGGADLHSSEETLVDASTAREHRIDWSQSDEMLPSERKGLKIQIPPLLRRTGSILALKGKLGGHSRRDSGDNNHNNNNNNTSSGSGNSKENNNRLRIVTIQEDCDEEAEAEADDGSTPMSPNSGSPRFGRGLWGRLRRN